ncbi:MAG: hypothetical protein IKB16_13135 [Lentisphaeria bacterium]|nr:hypothetical protein [Lentisphaeria bacterium]
MKQKLSKQQLRILADSEDFQKIIATDPVLDFLESLQYNERNEILNLQENLGFPIVFGKLSTRPLTPAKWAFLWLKKSPYTRVMDVLKKDAVYFLAVLSAKTLSEIPPLEEIRKRAAIPVTELHEQITAYLRRCFSPLQLLPASGNKEQPIRFDADWLFRICSIAAQESHTPIRQVMHGMSLNQVCWLYIDYRRKFDRHNAIRRRHSGEIAARMMDRALELGVEFFKS